jgi:hypothetical protein
MLSSSAPLISVIGLSLANSYASLPNVAVVTVHTRELHLLPTLSGEPRSAEDTDQRSQARQVADLKGFLATGFWGFWLGLDPEDSLLMLRDAGTQDVYSLDWIAAK